MVLVIRSAIRSAMASALLSAAILATAPHPILANATSLHLNFSDPPGRLIAMDVTIPYETVGTYYEVLGWSGTGNGYAGLQRTSGMRGNDGKTFVKHLHFSLWDTPNAKPIPMIWKRPEVVVQGFGGEGTGVKSLWPFDWQAGKRYTVVLKTWDSGPDETSFGTWFRDNGTGIWYRTATWGYPAKGVVIEGGNDSFVEDYQGNAAEVRESRIGPGWKMDLKGGWFPMKTCRFNANQDGTQKWEGGTVDGAFFMRTGGNTTATLARNTLLTIAMADTPSFAPQFPVLAAELRDSRVLAHWIPAPAGAPLFAYTLEVFPNADLTGAPLYSDSRTDPSAMADTSGVLETGAAGAAGAVAALMRFGVGPLHARLTLTDIFGRKTETRVTVATGTALWPGSEALRAAATPNPVTPHIDAVGRILAGKNRAAGATVQPRATRN